MAKISTLCNQVSLLRMPGNCMQLFKRVCSKLNFVLSNNLSYINEIDFDTQFNVEHYPVYTSAHQQNQLSTFLLSIILLAPRFNQPIRTVVYICLIDLTVFGQITIEYCSGYIVNSSQFLPLKLTSLCFSD